MYKPLSWIYLPLAPLFVFRYSPLSPEEGTFRTSYSIDYLTLNVELFGMSSSMYSPTLPHVSD